MSAPAEPSMDDRRLVSILTDEGTGLLHAAYFRLRLEEEFKKSWRFGWTYSLAVIDVLGLPPGRAGELAMLDLAGEVLTASRDIDLSARLARDRFAMLLPGTPAGGARTMVARVMSAALDRVGGQGVHLAVGLSECPQQALGSCDEFFARAVTAVGMARDQGEDQVVTWNAASR